MQSWAQMCFLVLCELGLGESANTYQKDLNLSTTKLSDSPLATLFNVKFPQLKFVASVCTKTSHLTQFHPRWIPN